MPASCYVSQRPPAAEFEKRVVEWFRTVKEDPGLDDEEGPSTTEAALKSPPDALPDGSMHRSRRAEIAPGNHVAAKSAVALHGK